jgi:two-component system sensor histidine kinase QseC
VTRNVVIGSCVLLLGAGLLLDTLIGRRLQADLDGALLARAQALATLTKQNERGVFFDFADEFMPEFAARSNASFFQVWLADGSLVEASRSLGESRLPPFETALGGVRFIGLTLPDGRNGRMVEIEFLPQIESSAMRARLRREAAIVQVARSSHDLEAMRENIREVIFGVSFALMFALAFLARLSVRWGLGPLSELGRQVAALDARSMEPPLRLTHPAVELDIFVSQFNSLLERVKRAFSAEQRFSANVAHELRTPLAELRALAEIGGRWPADQALVTGYLDDVRETTLQMEHLVFDLLELARHDFGTVTIRTGDFSLQALVEETWQRIQPFARGRQLELRCEPAAEIVIDRGREQFEGILNNLFANAVSYSPCDTVVICTLERSNGRIQIGVSNRVVDLESSDVPHLFERFWRKDPARSSGEHSGLGLALVTAYAQQVHFEVAAELDAKQRLHIRVSGLASLAV